MSTASTGQTLQKGLLSPTPPRRAVLLPGDPRGLQRGITLQNSRTPPSSRLCSWHSEHRTLEQAAGEAGAQEMPSHGVPERSSAGGRRLNSGDLRPPLCPSRSPWNCRTRASCSCPFPPASFPEEVERRQTLEKPFRAWPDQQRWLWGCCCSLTCTDPGGGWHCGPPDSPVCPCSLCLSSSVSQRPKKHCLEPVPYF